jgi:ribosomal-protein-alanine N-acetyltransferase
MFLHSHKMEFLMECNKSSIRLSTARLDLRPFAPSDTDALFAMHSDPEFMRYWGHPPFTSLSQAVRVINLDIDGSAAADESFIRLGVYLRDSDSLIGLCTMHEIDWRQRTAEIGFGIAKEYWQNGFMSESVSAIIQYAFDDLKLRRLTADIDPRNIASCKAIERLGFILEGVLRERNVEADEITSSAMYGLLSREWRNQFGQ